MIGGLNAGFRYALWWSLQRDHYTVASMSRIRLLMDTEVSNYTRMLVTHSSVQTWICKRCLGVGPEYLSNIVQSFGLFLKELKHIQLPSGAGQGEACCIEALMVQ